MLKKLGDSNSNLPIIVITGHGDSKTSGKAIELGAVAFFKKPFWSGALRVRPSGD